MHAPLRLRMTSIRIAFGSVHRRGHHALRESSGVSLVLGPRWLSLLSRHREAISATANPNPFVNKDWCTRKSVKRTIKVVRAKRLASAWQLKVSGSFSRELNQYSYNDEAASLVAFGETSISACNDSHSSQATATLGITPNLSIGSYDGKPCRDTELG